MATQRTCAFISYNDGKQDPHNRDYTLATRLADYLRRNGIDAEIKGYSSINNLNANTHQWLILIPSLGMDTSPQMVKTVDAILDQVVKRRMKGVLAITTDYDLPTKWITIRKYDASDPKAEEHALQGVLRAMQYAKVPYNEARALVQSQQAQQAAALAASQQQKKARMRNVGILIGAILVIIASLGGFVLFTIHPATTVIMPPSTVPPTLQGYQYYTQGPLAIKGFQSTQWTSSNSCKVDNSHPPTYQAIINTKGNYTRCMEKNLKFKNFALQVTMSIQGDAGGVIFRDDGHGTYYRLAFNQSSSSYSVYFCRSSACDASDPNVGSVNSGIPLLTDGSVSLEANKPITFTIIVIDSNIDLYKDNSLLTSLSLKPADANSNTSILVPAPTSAPTLTTTPSPTPTATATSAPTPTLIPSPTLPPVTIPSSGNIGVYAASLSSDTSVTFSNLKVWNLSDIRTKTPTPTPTKTPTPTPTPIP